MVSADENTKALVSLVIKDREKELPLVACQADRRLDLVSRKKVSAGDRPHRVSVLLTASSYSAAGVRRTRSAHSRSLRTLNSYAFSLFFRSERPHSATRASSIMDQPASSTDWDLLSSYAGLLVLATLSIYSGSYGSLPVSSQCTLHQRAYPSLAFQTEEQA